MLIPFMRGRVITALASAPDVLDALLGSIGLADPMWDNRPDPDRFTLREIVAHLADYEVIWPVRIAQTRDIAGPIIRMVDPGQLALDNDYASSDPLLHRKLFRERRTAFAGVLRSLQDDDWLKVAQMGNLGPLTLEEQAAFIAVHDGYHMGQVAQWLSAF